MSARWKAIELAVCKVFGGKRSGPVGKCGPDCIGTEPFAIQIKHSKQIPKSIQDYMEQTLRDAAQGSLPTLVLHPHGKAIDESLVVFRLKEFREFYL